MRPVIVSETLGDTSWSLTPVVTRTGMFDHPAAATCRLWREDNDPVPTWARRLEFAVTRLVVKP
jgi:hypothetical protein